MIRSFVVVAALSLAFRVGVQAQEHTVIALSHSDHTVYQLDGNSGRIVNQFEAENQPHESIVSPDGNTIFVAIPQAGHVVILDAATLQEKGRIDTEYFHRSDGTSTFLVLSEFREGNYRRSSSLSRRITISTSSSSRFSGSTANSSGSPN